MPVLKESQSVIIHAAPGYSYRTELTLAIFRRLNRTSRGSAPCGGKSNNPSPPINSKLSVASE
jgi:hypothetical protein